MNIYYVYILLDPRKNNQPFYVGKGSHDRILQHGKPYDTSNQFKTNVINAILDAGYELPRIKVAENISEKSALDIETHLISCYGRRNLDPAGILTNQTLGGEGCSGRVVSDKTRQKLSESHTGKQFTESHRMALSKSHSGKKFTETHKMNISKANTGNKLSDEHKEKISIANSGKNNGMYGKISPRKGVSLSDEIKRKLSIANKGKTASDNTRRKMSDAKKGRRMSEETKRKISESNKRRHALSKERINEEENISW